jgi:hypothetical protein
MNVSKLVFVATCSLAVVGAAFLGGLYSAMHENVAYQFVGKVYMSIKNSLAAISETPLLVPKGFLQPARNGGAGVIVNGLPDDGNLILLSGFFDDGNELRLIRRDGYVVRRWPVKFSDYFPEPRHLETPPATNWSIDLHGALIEPDGSVVFNFDYGGLVKLDRCGRTAWTLAHPTHHSIEQAEGGGYWVPGRRHIATGRSAFPPFEAPFDEDLVLRVTVDGQITAEFSVPELFYRNQLTALLTATGENFRHEMTWDHEILHLNKVTELQSEIAGKFPGFKAGDLALSLREQNMLLIVDPVSLVVKWWQIGPWVRQHDPEFSGDGTITIFNNNAYRTALFEGDAVDLSAPRISNIMAVDPVTRSVRVLYGGKSGEEMLTVIRGKQQATARGGFLVTEFEAGRAFETDASGKIVWEYINRYDADRIAELTEARIYPSGYFDVEDWHCGESGSSQEQPIGD